MNPTPSAPEDLRGEIDHSLYGKGIVFFETNDYRSAISAFKEALVYWPEDSLAWLALGQCYDADNKPRRAAKCFRQALKFETEETRDSALYGLGVSFFDQGLFEEAIEQFEQVSESAEFQSVAQRNIQTAKNWLETDKLQSKQQLKPEKLERIR
ncbi:MAG: tetratricopeptide repeat protein [Acidiferrobacterales bacterium]|nr:tetratricopeptide repeat protein [Acidiferrobacterales bacterium]